MDANNIFPALLLIGLCLLLIFGSWMAYEVIIGMHNYNVNEIAYQNARHQYQDALDNLANKLEKNVIKED